MKKQGFIWRESVYKNGFKCQCGNELADPMTGAPRGYVLFDPVQEVIYCNKCMRAVCFCGEMESDLPNGLYGDINEFLKGKE